MVASDINETLENAGNKSFLMDLTLTTETSDVSPVIDMDRASWIARMESDSNFIKFYRSYAYPNDGNEYSHECKISTIKKRLS